MSDRELRRRLAQYPGMTEEKINAAMRAYDERRAQKTALLQRGFSNRRAEKWLDKTGFPRPPGWQSVFFYPDSLMPRWRYLLLAAGGLLLVLL
ncbi:MAG: hypothetical protein DCC73_11510 [Proteobacteria bacterium]|nr:MAG: hypothetical protein DCC73_11510 [Pseudomonadota bacterium]